MECQFNAWHPCGHQISIEAFRTAALVDTGGKIGVPQSLLALLKELGTLELQCETLKTQLEGLFLMAALLSEGPGATDSVNAANLMWPVPGHPFFNQWLTAFEQVVLSDSGIPEFLECACCSRDR